jgi:hypothetical protein
VLEAALAPGAAASSSSSSSSSSRAEQYSSRAEQYNTNQQYDNRHSSRFYTNDLEKRQLLFDLGIRFLFFFFFAGMCLSFVWLFFFFVVVLAHLNEQVREGTNNMQYTLDGVFPK